MARTPALIRYILRILNDGPSVTITVPPPTPVESLNSQRVTAAAAAAGGEPAGVAMASTCARCRPWTRSQRSSPSAKAAAAATGVESAGKTTAPTRARYRSWARDFPPMKDAAEVAGREPAEGTRMSTCARCRPWKMNQRNSPSVKAAAATATSELVKEEAAATSRIRNAAASTTNSSRVAPAGSAESAGVKPLQESTCKQGPAEGVIRATAPREEAYDQYLDLFVYGIPKSSFWRQIWKCKPLILHDKGFIRPMEFLKSGGRKECPTLDMEGLPNFTSELSAVLEAHPGPIQYFRLDSSEWSNGTEQICNWVKLLNSKSVNEVIVINLSCSTQTPFPIYEMQSAQKLVIGFFALPPTEGVSCQLSLRVLKLFCCTYDAFSLHTVVNQCSVLEELHVGFSDVDIRIQSKSLKILQIFCSKGSELVLDCPQLLILSAGITSRNKLKVYIKADGITNLRELHWIQLAVHRYVEGSSIFLNLKLLHIGIELLDREQRRRLSKILETTPMLSTLKVMRMDAVGSNELYEIASDMTFWELKNVYCVQHHLKVLELEPFLGGDAETDLVCALMKGANFLQHVMLQPGMSSCSKAISNAMREIGVYLPPTSAECTITLGTCPGKF